MEQLILKEELGIANDVNNITKLVKESISQNFVQNKNDKTKYSFYNYKNDKSHLYSNNFVLKLNSFNVDINIIYYILINPSEELKESYLGNNSSTSDIEKYELIFYLTLNNNKIEWKRFTPIIQHEVEHLYQLLKKETPLLNKKQIDNYYKMHKLRHSNNPIEVLIGYVYYYVINVEKNALLNQLYREIMDSYSPGMNFNAIDKLKETVHYENIQIIKSIINNDYILQKIENKLVIYNKSLKSFLKTVNYVVNTYTKLFGRLIYKVNKDIDEIQKHHTPTFNNVNLSDLLKNLNNYDEKSPSFREGMNRHPY